MDALSSTPSSSRADGSEGIFGEAANLRVGGSGRSDYPGAVWGAECRSRTLVGAGGCQCELAFRLVNARTALSGTFCRSMVRRRSTVRFRKGAPPGQRPYGAFRDVLSVYGKEKVYGSIP